MNKSRQSRNESSRLAPRDAGLFTMTSRGARGILFLLVMSVAAIGAEQPKKSAVPAAISTVS